MRFRNDDFPRINKDLTDTVTEEHPIHIAAVAEERIKAMHHHDDGSQVELHQVGSREFITQSMQGSLEGKIGSDSDWQPQHDLFTETKSNTARLVPSPEAKWKGQSKNLDAAKIEYEKKSSQGQPQQLYGTQQSVTGVSHSQETMMMGCNCGAEWTVTGQSAKAQGAEGVKIEQYGSSGGGSAGYRISAGAGGEKAEYRTGAGQQQDYKG